jgi:hypothetical protein
VAAPFVPGSDSDVSPSANQGVENQSMGASTSTAGDAPEPFRTWSLDAVCTQLEKMGLADLVQMCRENNINGDLALAMTKEDLEEIGVTGFKQKRVLSALNPLKGEDEKLLMMAAKLKAMEAKQGAQEDEWQKHQKDKPKPQSSPAASSSTVSAGTSEGGAGQTKDKQASSKRKRAEDPAPEQSFEIATVGHGKRLAGNKSKIVYPSGFVKNGWCAQFFPFFFPFVLPSTVLICVCVCVMDHGQAVQRRRLCDARVRRCGTVDRSHQDRIRQGRRRRGASRLPLVLPTT